MPRPPKKSGSVRSSPKDRSNALPADEAVAVRGELRKKLAAISSSSISLLVTIGHLVIDGNQTNTQVLVPIVEFHLAGEDDDKPATVDVLLPFDNVPFLIMDMSMEFSQCCAQLKELEGQSILIQKDLIQRTAGLLEEAENYLHNSRQILLGLVTEDDKAPARIRPGSGN